MSPLFPFSCVLLSLLFPLSSFLVFPLWSLLSFVVFLLSVVCHGVPTVLLSVLVSPLFSVISPGVLCPLCSSSVLVSPLICSWWPVWIFCDDVLVYHLLWCPLCSIIGPGVPSSLSITCPGILSVLFTICPEVHKVLCGFDIPTVFSYGLSLYFICSQCHLPWCLCCSLSYNRSLLCLNGGLK